MCFLYILQSESSGRFYVGSTDDLDRRLSEHLRGHTPSTRGRGPWKLVYTEPFGTLIQESQRPISMRVFSSLVKCKIDSIRQPQSSWPQLRRTNEDDEASVGIDHRSKRVIVPLRSVQRDRYATRVTGAKRRGRSGRIPWRALFVQFRGIED